MPFCLDASAAIAAVLPHPASAAAADFLEDSLSRGERLVAPPLLYAETTSVLRRHVHIGAIQHHEAVIGLEDLLAIPITLVGDSTVYLRALDFARHLGHAKAYDVQYLAVASVQDCPVVTLDRGLHESAHTLGIASRLIL